MAKKSVGGHCKVLLVQVRPNDAGQLVRYGWTDDESEGGSESWATIQHNKHTHRLKETPNLYPFMCWPCISNPTLETERAWKLARDY